jgi:opacity protein-like surface antigen
VVNTGLGFDSSPLFGVGVGYQWNHWLRFDVTGEYRGKANFHGIDIVTTGAGTKYTDNYTASKSEWVGLVNAYVDLGTWWHVTPFIGAGVGFARNTISSFTDTCVIVNVCTNGSVATGATASKWNFAWAAHAGVAYQVTPAFTVELAYRYIDLGDAQSGDLVAFDGTNNVNNPMHFNHLTSHDVKLGVRWMFESEPMYAPPPLVRKG